MTQQEAADRAVVVQAFARLAATPANHQLATKALECFYRLLSKDYPPDAILENESKVQVN